MEKVRQPFQNYCRRYFVLTKKYLLSFKDEVSYKDPTEVLEMLYCTTVKSADDESYKHNSFVSR